MATPVMINVPPQFNMNTFVEQLGQIYQQKGFIVTATNFGTGVSIKFDKGVGGINMLLGLGQGVTANCTLNGSTLTVNYSDEDWTGKIIGLAVGWILCWVPFVCAIIGIVRQVNLTKDISSNIRMLVGGGQPGVMMGGQMPYAQPAQPAPQAYQQAPVAQPVNQQPAQAVVEQVVVEEVVETAAPASAGWSCSCGAQNTEEGAFCYQCGSPRPQQ